MTVHPATDDDVKRAVAQHEAWMRKAMPSLLETHAVQPRVFISDDVAECLRRPFKVSGRGWCVRVHGVARLVNPTVKTGEIVFELDYSK